MLNKENDKKSDIMIDSYLRKTLVHPDYSAYNMEPSDDFASKVMSEAISCEKRRAKNISIGITVLALSPFIGRELWLILRNDYFSISTLPLGETIVKAYGIFMSPYTFVVFLTIGLSATTIVYLKKWKNIDNIQDTAKAKMA